MKKFVLAFLVMAVFGFAQAQTMEEVLSQVKKYNEKYTTMSCAFTHTNYLKMMTKPIVSTGTLYFEKTDKLSMIYENPKGEFLVMNGDRFAMVLAGRSVSMNANNNKRVASMKSMILSFIDGHLDKAELQEKIDLALNTNEKANVVSVILDPKENKGKVVSVDISFDKNTAEILSIQVNEKNGNYSIYELGEKTFNQEIDQKVFNISKKELKKSDNF